MAPAMQRTASRPAAEAKDPLERPPSTTILPMVKPTDLRPPAPSSVALSQRPRHAASGGRANWGRPLELRLERAKLRLDESVLDHGDHHRDQEAAAPLAPQLILEDDAGAAAAVVDD